MASRIRRDGGPWELLYSPKVDPPPLRRCPSCGRRCVASLKHVPLCHKCKLSKADRLELLGFEPVENLRARHHEKMLSITAEHKKQRAMAHLAGWKAWLAGGMPQPAGFQRLPTPEELLRTFAQIEQQSTAESTAPLPTSLQTLVIRDTAESTTP